MTLEQIEHEFTVDVYIDQQNSYNKALIIPALKSKWIGLYHRETRRLRLLKQKRERFKHESQVALSSGSKIALTSHEVEQLRIVAKSDILILDDDINECAEKVAMYKSYMGAIMFINNDLKNIIDLLKLEEV